MEFDSKMIRLTVAVLLFLAGTSIVAKNNDVELVKGQVDGMLLDVHQAFNEAENDILNIEPDPEPDPEPLGPDPDASKCICKGTGIITHGDGHTTDCPYHKNKDETKVCAEDCKRDCDEGCNCANSSGCIQQATYQHISMSAYQRTSTIHISNGLASRGITQGETKCRKTVSDQASFSTCVPRHRCSRNAQQTDAIAVMPLASGSQEHDPPCCARPPAAEVLTWDLELLRARLPAAARARILRPK